MAGNEYYNDRARFYHEMGRLARVYHNLENDFRGFKYSKNMVKLIDTLEDNDDIQEIYHNWEIPDDLDIE